LSLSRQIMREHKGGGNNSPLDPRQRNGLHAEILNYSTSYHAHRNRYASSFPFIR
jgi:hypothetical protein